MNTETHIILPRRLGEKLRERAEEEGYLPDELAVELVRNGLKELDQEELVEHYRAINILLRQKSWVMEI